jgi:hypothetical protein
MLAAHDRRRLLHFVIDDPASTTVESTEALRVLGEMTGQPARSHRRGRNANVPLTQADIDADLEQALTFRNNDGLTTGDQIEIEHGYDLATKRILDAILDNIVLWLFSANETDVPVLIDIVNRTDGSLVKTKALDALRLISTRIATSIQPRQLDGGV